MRHAIRSLLNDRTYTTVALLTLAFGIAVNTIMFSIVNGVLLRPLAWRDGGRLVLINEIVPESASSYPRLPVNERHFFEWRDRSVSFAALAIVEGRRFVLARAGEPEQIRGARVSATLLPMLGVAPEIGRNFIEDEDHPGSDRVALISDELWNRKFHRDPGIVGSSITLDGTARTVVGILSASFHFPRPQGPFGSLPRNPDVLIPAAFQRDAVEWLGDFNYTVIGRLNRGVSFQQALTELDVIQASIATNFPEKVHLRAAIAPLQDEMVGPVRRGLLILFGAVSAVLLIVCVNLANLTLGRVAGRRRDLAIRTALGANRWQVVRHILAESICIALAGGVVGTALASQGLPAVLRYAPVDLPRIEEIHLDMGVLFFAMGLSIVTGLLMGILPAWRAASADPQDSLRGSSHTATEKPGGVHARHLLVCFESALSAVLLIVAGLMIVSFVRLLKVDKGFDSDHLIAVEINLPATDYVDGKKREAYYRELVAKLHNISGAVSAALISHLPLEGEDWGDFIRKAGDHRPSFEQTNANYRFCSPDYFRTMGIPLLTGTGFNEADRNRNPAVISESAAQAVWPGENPIGREFDRGNENEPLFKVVAVVRDVRVGMANAPLPTVYVPYWHRSRSKMEAVVRTSMDPRSIAASIRSAVWSLDPNAAIGQVRTMQNIVSDSVGQRRFQMWLISGFAASALFLACLGIYGVVSWSVSRRTNEIAIRMALGARSGELHAMVVGEALRPVFAGLLLGVAGALAVGRVLNSVLFGVTGHDPGTILTVLVLLGSVAALACYIPSRRAVQHSVLDALRQE
jgi:predicted permease